MIVVYGCFYQVTIYSLKSYLLSSPFPLCPPLHHFFLLFPLSIIPLNPFPPSSFPFLSLLLSLSPYFPLPLPPPSSLSFSLLTHSSFSPSYPLSLLLLPTQLPPSPSSSLPPLLSPGPKVKSIAQLQELDRFTEPPFTGPLCDLLWSDPLLEEVLGYELSDQEFTEVSSVHPVPFPFSSIVESSHGMQPLEMLELIRILTRVVYSADTRFVVKISTNVSTGLPHSLLYSCMC